MSDSEKKGNNSIEDHKENDNKLTNLSLIENTDFKNFLINEYRWAEKNKIKLNCYEEIETVANWYDSQKEIIDTKFTYMKKKNSKYSRTLNQSYIMKLRVVIGRKKANWRCWRK